MSCVVCRHSWCWTCGFGENHWFHKVLFGGGLCHALNIINFQLGARLHWTLKALLTLLAVCLAPLLTFVLLLVLLASEISEKVRYDSRLCCLVKPRQSSSAFYRCLYAPVACILVVFLALLGVLAAALFVCVFLVPGYIALAIVLGNMLLRQCCKSKHGEMSEDQVKLLEGYQERQQNRFKAQR